MLVLFDFLAFFSICCHLSKQGNYVFEKQRNNKPNIKTTHYQVFSLLQLLK